jgi:formaldehyde-activating enzyme involved in methanogenesis
MKTKNKLLYMSLGGLAVLALVFGAVVAFAQTGAGDSDGTTPDPPAEEGSDVQPPAPRGWGWHHRGFIDPEVGDRTSDEELLAEELGISVEELREAYEAARAAAIQQAVTDGLITQEQADQLLSGGAMFHGRFGPGLAGKNQEEHLAELVESGHMTQEQADLMIARQAVQNYIDGEALAETLRSAYEAAIEQALADGAITQDQADQLLQGYQGFNGFGGGRGFHGGPAGKGFFHGGPAGPGFFQRGMPPAFNPSVAEPTSGA